jgi:subtilisin-like proprotein convertase family protein
MTPPKLILALFVFNSGLLFSAVLPEPVEDFEMGSPVFQATGIVESEVGEGSGAVAVSPRIVVSCAHVVFDDYILSASAVWTYDNRFTRAWNGMAPPQAEDSIPLRGYTRWAAYSNEARKSGGSSRAAFRNDLAVHYSYRDLADGPVPKMSRDGLAALSGDQSKLITGYPGGLYDAGDPLEYRLHVTGPFSGRMRQDSGRYLFLNGVGTGPGNSGGPAWVWNPLDAEWILSGVLVSGTDFYGDGTGASIGVVALDAQARLLVQSAVQLGQTSSPPSEPSSFAATGLPLAIPDNNRNGVTMEIPVSVSQAFTGTLAVGIRVTHPYPRDLEITLRAPGRSRSSKAVLLARPLATWVEDFEWKARAVQGFESVNPNGVWRLTVRDLARNDVGQIESATLFVGGF